MKVALLCGVLAASVLGTASAAPNPISIEITPRSCVAPCNVRLLVRVQPDEANRKLTIRTESDLFGRSTSRTLDGDRSATVYEMILTNLETGLYDVRVSVDRAADSPSQQKSQFAVH